VPGDDFLLETWLPSGNRFHVTAAAGTYDIPFDFRLRAKVVRARLVGVTEEFQKIRNLIMISGRYFDQEDLFPAKVCLVTEHIARNIFNHEPAIGTRCNWSICVAPLLACSAKAWLRSAIRNSGRNRAGSLPLDQDPHGRRFFQVIYAQSARPMKWR